MTTDVAPAPAPLAAPLGEAADLLGHPAVRGRPPRQRPGRDPQLRPAPGRVRGDLLHRRLPRADEHPRRRRPARADPRDGGVAARPRPRPGALHALRPEPPARVHRARLAARDRHAGQLAGADADLQGEEARSQPDDVNHGLLTYPVLQAADIVIYKASLVPGRQGPGRPPRAVARDRPRLQPPLRRHVPRAAGGLHRGADRPRHRRRPAR